MLVKQLLVSLEASLKKKNVTAKWRGENCLMVPMAFAPMVYSELQQFEDSCKNRRMTLKKSIELIDGEEYEIFEIVI